MSTVISLVRGSIVAVASMVIAGGLAMAGGMPSDEGPEVVPDEVGYDDTNTYESGLPGEATIAAIIKAEIPDYVDAAWADEAASGSAAEFKLPPAFIPTVGGVVAGR